MGMYTALHFNSELNIAKDSSAAKILKFMLGELEQNTEKLPNHELFKTTRWNWMFQCDSYYFDEDTHSTMRWDEISNAYYLCLRFNMKNYDSEIEKFIDWINPYLKKHDGEFLGFFRYEEDEEPTLIYYKETPDRIKTLEEEDKQ